MVIEELACSLDRNDEEPNILLATRLAKSEDKQQIAEVVAGLSSEREAIANDCIKVLYEIGYRNPSVIAEHVEVFIKLLKSRNNRIVWGSMIALSTISQIKAKRIFLDIDIVLRAFENGSAITRDNAISVFSGVSKSDKAFEEKLFPIIIEHLSSCRPKEIPQHAERAMVCGNKSNKSEFLRVLRERFELLTDSQKKRVDRVIKALEKI